MALSPLQRDNDAVFTMFNHAIARKPGRTLAEGLTTAGLGKPDFELARIQHRDYVRALEGCGLKVEVLAAADDFPDSVFVEDVAVCAPSCVILTRPGAASRRGEAALIAADLEARFECVERIEHGTLDGGDVMMVGTHYFIGLSERTNTTGAREFREILARHGLSGSTVSFEGMLHLKSGVAYLENDNLLATREAGAHPQFASFHVLEVPRAEAYAANSVWVNDRVLMPSRYPRTRALVEKAGYTVVEVDTSEFRKLDGGVSCLSLRY
jgi:dimethylargininase